MLRVVVCCADAARADLDLGSSRLWRRDVYRRVVTDAEGAREAVRHRPRLVLLERDLPWAASFIRAVREDEATRSTSIAVYAAGEFDPVEAELLQSGANAVLRLPATRGWDKPLSRLLHVPPREAVRVPVYVEVETADDRRTALGTTVNLSETGILIQGPPLDLRAEIECAFRLPGAEDDVRGRARVVRVAAEDSFGIEFSEIDGECLEAIRDFVVRRAGKNPAGSA